MEDSEPYQFLVTPAILKQVVEFDHDQLRVSDQVFYETSIGSNPESSSAFDEADFSDFNASATTLQDVWDKASLEYRAEVLNREVASKSSFKDDYLSVTPELETKINLDDESDDNRSYSESEAAILNLLSFDSQMDITIIEGGQDQVDSTDFTSTGSQFDSVFSNLTLSSSTSLSYPDQTSSSQLAFLRISGSFSNDIHFLISSMYNSSIFVEEQKLRLNAQMLQESDSAKLNVLESCFDSDSLLDPSHFSG